MPDMERFDFSRFDLQDYVNRFPEEMREPIVAAIFEEKLLQEAFADDKGKTILKSALDVIHQNIYDILIACRDMKENYVNEVVRSASRVNAVYDIMYIWSKVFADGTKHRQSVKKTK